ncbi:ATP-binding cassette domain-containing protein [Ornithinibacillus sp. L9]|uniref:ATP-binding cassette domain-containing protein n=1 Tax=Ornithinibacillus caprae TaxID=2678566 RepID=A0A6N8FMX7_9BACI|nr:ABC transporter ATP-binding protein [Ornithinibacillus caprae]MUK90116.1 ATP-binding cassette domain-containing protein [Ornithinibacillus caprae]
MLELKKISVAYKDKKVLDNLSFTAHEGEIIGVVAPNGTGKTTLFNVMANFIKPKTGEVIYKERHTYKSERAELFIHKNLSTFPDQSDLFDELTGMDHMKLYGSMWKKSTKHIQEIVDYLQMNDYVKRKVRTYSLGMRQRLCFAMMVATDTSIMLMDEVMNGLDVSNVALISKRLIQMKEEKKLIFVASHLLENLDLYADRVIFLKDGNIIHEQRFHGETEDYIKLEIEHDQYEKLKNMLPANHMYIANHILCLPLKGMNISEQTKWIENLLDFNEKELTIGPLGTVEYYEKYYLENE